MCPVIGVPRWYDHKKGYGHLCFHHSLCP